MPPRTSAVNSYGRVASAGECTCRLGFRHAVASSLTYLTAFILYDYAITFDEEVEMFWKDAFAKRKLTGAAALFLVNRYLVLGLRLANLFGFAPMTDKQHVVRSTRIAYADNGLAVHSQQELPLVSRFCNMRLGQVSPPSVIRA